MNVTSQMRSLTSLTPTFWPANTVLRLILRGPKQIRPQRVTVIVFTGFYSWYLEYY